MKAVFLILYFWHGSTRGGPAMSIAPMPSLAACEAVGRAAKELADQQPFGHRGSTWSITGSDGYYLPAVYRCVEVAAQSQGRP